MVMMGQGAAYVQSLFPQGNLGLEERDGSFKARIRRWGALS